MAITTRAGKGSPLEWAEVDANWADLVAADATEAASRAAAITSEAAARVAGDALGLLKASNLSDLASAATARTNLGLAAIAANGSASDLIAGTVPSVRLTQAAADGATLGIAAFTAADFNAASGVVSIDYANAQAANAGAKGFLTAADWTAFNAKQAALGFTPFANPMTTGGDLIYGGASGVATRLVNGGAGELFLSNGTTLAPQWSGAGLIYAPVVHSGYSGDLGLRAGPAESSLDPSIQNYARGLHHFTSLNNNIGVGIESEANDASGHVGLYIVSLNHQVSCAAAELDSYLSGTGGAGTYLHGVESYAESDTASPVDHIFVYASLGPASAVGGVGVVADFGASVSGVAGAIIRTGLYSDLPAAAGNWAVYSKFAKSYLGGGALIPTLSASQVVLTDSDKNLVSGGALGSAAFTSSAAYEVPLTFSTGLSRIGDTITATGTTPGDAAADGTTKGIAAFVAADFNASAGVISLDYASAQKATASVPGFLTAADWTTFNGKQAAGSYITSGGALGTPSSGNLANCTNYPAQPLRGYIAGLTLSRSSATVLGVAAGVACDSTAATMVTLGAFTKSTAGSWTAGTGNNGMGTGLTIANSTWYHVFAIINAGAADVYFDTSASAANKPASTTAFRRIGSFLTDGSAQIVPFTQVEETIYWATVVKDVGTSQDWSAGILVVLASVPTGVRVRPLLRCGIPTGTAVGFSVQSPDETNIAPQASSSTVVPMQDVTSNALGLTIFNSMGELYTDTSAQLRVRASANNTSSFSIHTRGYIDSRGAFA